MLVVYRAMMWMPFLTGLLALGCIAWLVWAISIPSYAMMFPSGFGIMTFSMVSAIGFYVRKKMIQAELLFQEQAIQLAKKAAKALDDYYVEQVNKAADPTASLNSDIDLDEMRFEMERLAEQKQWRNEHTTTSQSS